MPVYARPVDWTEFFLMDNFTNESIENEIMFHRCYANILLILTTMSKHLLL